MRALIAMTAAAAILVGSTGVYAGEPGGCLKYGAAGAAGGHFVGKGHALLGGAAGCAAGMYTRHKHRKQQQQMMNGSSH